LTSTPQTAPNNETMQRDLSTMSDSALAMLVARWQEDALAEIYRRHAGALYALARRLLFDPRLGEDVVQEVFLRLWNAPERFDADRGSLRAFLLADTHGRAVDMVRADAARRRRESREASTAVVVTELEHDISDESVVEQVRLAVEKLPPEERRAIELSYFGGHTYREVASLLEEPEGTIKGRIRAALRRLRGELAVARNEGWEAIR
jgi:RNA polymerase sigma-70 factor, ECF subfamily